jgi:nitronate monooxygenase
MVSPMFLVSCVDLAVESCKAGLIGSLTRNHCRTDEEFEEQLRAARDALNRAKAANPDQIIGPLAANISIRLDGATWAKSLALCRHYGIDIIVTASGDPTDAAKAVHEWGAQIFHDVTSLRFAEKAIRAGVDGLIAIGAGGGGHSGTLSHLALIPQLRAIFDGTIVMAGAVGNGAAIRAAEVLGADLAYLGTRFIATEESMAPQEYKELLVSQSSSDLIYTKDINGLPAMWMKESIRRHGLDPDNLPVATTHGTEHLPPDVKPWSNLFSAGQGIGFIDEILPVRQVVQKLREEYDRACAIPAWHMRSKER